MTRPEQTEARPLTLSEADETVRGVAAHAHAWLSVGLDQRRRYLSAARGKLLEQAPQWVTLATRAKGTSGNDAAAGEEWISGPLVTLRMLRLLEETLDGLGTPGSAPRVEERLGRQIAHVVPGSLVDRLAYSGISGELWIQPGRTATRAAAYRDDAARAARLCLVLGAGNIGSITPLDALHKLFVENQVVVVKMNPVNSYLMPLLRDVFADLIADGFLEFVEGDATLGAFLCEHAAVDTIHVTGSSQTHDAIVWSRDPEERRARQVSGTPRLNKPITSELGCVTPVVVVPGRWKASALEFQAMRVASMLTHNVSFNCNAAKVLVLPQSWFLKDAFLDALRCALRSIEPRPAYYPGAESRYREFVSRYPDAEQLGTAPSGALPWTLIPGVSPNASEYALQKEAFCGVLAVTELNEGGTNDPLAFLESATEFVNTSVEGTLSCSVLIDDASQNSDRDRFETCLATLRYGGIGVNAWPGVQFALGQPSWGAFPGHTLANVGSGIGTVHNSWMYDHPERAVIRAPFTSSLKPPWFADHGNPLAVARKAAAMEGEPSLKKVPSLIWSALWS